MSNFILTNIPQPNYIYIYYQRELNKKQQKNYI